MSLKIKHIKTWPNFVGHFRYLNFVPSETWVLRIWVADFQWPNAWWALIYIDQDWHKQRWMRIWWPPLWAMCTSNSFKHFNFFCGKCHRTRVVWIKFRVLWFPVCCHSNSVVLSMYSYLQDMVWTCMNWMASLSVLFSYQTYWIIIITILWFWTLLLPLTMLFKVVKLKNSSLFRFPQSHMISLFRSTTQQLHCIAALLSFLAALMKPVQSTAAAWKEARMRKIRKS